MPLSKAILHPRPVSFLYRRVMKSVPKVMVLYDLDMTQKEVQSSVRTLSRKHAGVSDPRIVDRLLYDGEVQLAETVEMWKQKSHLARLLKREG